jgi:hypothetical protein
MTNGRNYFFRETKAKLRKPVVALVKGQASMTILLKNPHDFLPFLGLGRWRMSHSL